MNEILTMIREKLPTQYSQAFSLHLSNYSCSNFDNLMVEEVVSHYGKAFLVYKNGHKE